MRAIGRVLKRSVTTISRELRKELIAYLWMAAAAQCRIAVYFCDPYSPWHKGRVTWPRLTSK